MSLISSKGRPLLGSIEVPGDKSISHRALILGALAIGKTKITGLLEGEDVIATAVAMRQLGAIIEPGQKDGFRNWTVIGRGVGGLSEPEQILNMGNSGTAARLLLGLLATHSFETTMIGDKSLSSRPMERVMAPLRDIGCNFISRSGGKLPITTIGTINALPSDLTLKIPSAQIKSALLLAGLNSPGITRIIEKNPSRDHTEKMLKYFGAEIDVIINDDGSREILLKGYPELEGKNLNIPGDISSAAFLIVAAVITPGSDLTLKNIGINPLRVGLLDSLREMGANITIHNVKNSINEPSADIHVVHSPLNGVVIPSSRAPMMIDEYPILSIAASVAEGETSFEGIGELRVKESDRLKAISEGLEVCGIKIHSTKTSLRIFGRGSPPLGNGLVHSYLDHRIAMSFLILGLVSDNPIEIDDESPIKTSFPNFITLMNSIGGQIMPASK